MSVDSMLQKSLHLILLLKNEIDLSINCLRKYVRKRNSNSEKIKSLYLQTNWSYYLIINAK